MRSAPRTCSTGPRSDVSSIFSSSTDESPIGFGLNGERVAKTPMRTFPPRRGGRTVGDHLSVTDSEKHHISHMCENPSSPRTASGSRYSGSNTRPLRRPQLRSDAVFRILCQRACVFVLLFSFPAYVSPALVDFFRLLLYYIV